MWQVLNMPMPARRGLREQLRQLHERLVFNGIVFTMSWEDPEMDRRAFRIRPDVDTVISITSAGCNPLNFLCQNPKRLISVDGNPAQNAVLEMKLAAIQALDYEDFANIFAARRPQVVQRYYRPLLRPLLSDSARAYWDKKLWLLSRNLYQFGSMGIYCRFLSWYLSAIGISKRRREQLLQLRTLAEQREFYHRYVAHRLWGPGARVLINEPAMYLAGVHPSQYDLVDERHGMYAYVKERIEYALTQVPIYDNYFISIALTGEFQGDRVPPYLLAENFETLRKNLDRVTVVNGYLGPFLETQPEASISKFNLLDIFDWMVTAQPLFESTWQSILRAATPDATMIYRSGSYRLDPPDCVTDQLAFDPELSRELFAIDRSATYGSFYVYHARKQPQNGRLPHPSAVAAVG
jgi:S-adenosylmethionine-diacylglycerol 3-amino-3-carboxypropyl transferase